MDPIKQKFLKLCKKAAAEDLLDPFLDFFLTMEEIELLKARYLIVQSLLKGGMPQREISEKLKVSISQITRGSNQLKRTPKNLKKFLEENL